MELETKELGSIIGGGSAFWTVLSGIGAFVTGIIAGFLNASGVCSKEGS